MSLASTDYRGEVFWGITLLCITFCSVYVVSSLAKTEEISPPCFDSKSVFERIHLEVRKGEYGAALQIFRKCSFSQADISRFSIDELLEVADMFFVVEGRQKASTWLQSNIDTLRQESVALSKKDDSVVRARKVFLLKEKLFTLLHKFLTELGQTTYYHLRQVAQEKERCRDELSPLNDLLGIEQNQMDILSLLMRCAKSTQQWKRYSAYLLTSYELNPYESSINDALVEASLYLGKNEPILSYVKRFGARELTPIQRLAYVKVLIDNGENSQARKILSPLDTLALDPVAMAKKIFLSCTLQRNFAPFYHFLEKNRDVQKQIREFDPYHMHEKLLMGEASPLSQK